MRTARHSALSRYRLSSETPVQPTYLQWEGIHGYLVGPEVGRGAYATVRLGLDARADNREVAMKFYNNKLLFDASRKQSLEREFKILATLRHPNILEYVDAVETPNYTVLVTEYVVGQSLQAKLKTMPYHKLQEAEAQRAFLGLAQAVAYCHSQQVAHRDITLDNVLVTAEYEVKLIDFGFATHMEPRRRVFCGTPSFMAPEIVERKEHWGPPVDVWACGVVLYAMLCGELPFKASRKDELYCKIKLGVYVVPDSVPPNARKLIQSMLANSPEDRPTAAEILQSDWLAHL